MDRLATQDIIPPTVDASEIDDSEWVVEPTQVYIPTTQESTKRAVAAEKERRAAVTQKSSSSIASNFEDSFLPPNTLREVEPEALSDEPNESDGNDGLKNDVSSKSSSSSSPAVVKTDAPPRSKRIDEVEFEEWLAERKRRKKLRKKRANEARSFFEAEAEESEDEELGGIMRRQRGGDSENDSAAGGSSDDSDEDSDLEDLVASAADEFALEKKAKKDSKKLAKMHAKWASERDAILEKAIEDRDFFRRNRRATAVDGIGGDDVNGGLNRLQRKLKARRDAMVDQFDKDGNLLAPEFVDDESDYDSMDIDSDEFIDEDWEDDVEGGGDRPEEIAARKERKEREKERRKKEFEFKAEMAKRRALLREKLRQERLMREKDKREIQSGLGIMNEEDREVFKMINRSQVFGASTTGNAVGTGKPSVTQSAAATTNSSQFSFLSSRDPQEVKGGSSLPNRRRRSSLDFD
jgi:hypothetical protein